MAKRRSTADADDGGAKTPRKPNFSDADVRLLLNKYLEKKSIFQNEENSVINNRAQEGEWERIAQAMNSQNPLLCRSWKEIRKKYYNLASEAKKLHTKQKASMLATGGGVVDPDVAARSYEELPFWARFILEEILPAVIVDGVEGGFESETNAAAALEADDTQEFDSPPESTQTTITTTAADDISTLFYFV
uniref:Regulatory protein zeste n=1 Tax=Plectus sambesii TaxID=2011161 RepID=A0A914W3H8_9BILA